MTRRPKLRNKLRYLRMLMGTRLRGDSSIGIAQQRRRLALHALVLGLGLAMRTEIS